MFNMIATLIRGRANDLAEVAADANALSALRQQLRDCADAVDNGRRSIALIMAYAERERRQLERIAAQTADLEGRAMAALAKGREDLATEAAGTLAQLEAERDATARAIATYDSEIVGLRTILSEGEARLAELQRAQRLAVATEQTQRLRSHVPLPHASSFEAADATLRRIQDRQTQTESVRVAMVELTSASHANQMRDRLAAAGCGAPLRPDAAAILQHLKDRAA